MQANSGRLITLSLSILLLIVVIGREALSADLSARGSLLIGSLSAFLALYGLEPRWCRQRIARAFSSLALMLLSLLVLVSAELYFLNASLLNDSSMPRTVVANFFHALWWYVPAGLVYLALSRFIFEAAEQRVGHPVPSVVRVGSLAAIMITTSLWVLASVFGFEVGGALLTSGVLTLFIGFTLRNNISNVFSGIVLNVERAFAPGDWITVNGSTGKVVDIGWRTTRIQTFNNASLSIPNDAMAAAEVLNWDDRSDDFGEGFWIFLELHFDPRHDPARITELLYAALDTVKPADGREELALKWVRCIGADQYGLDFRVAFDCLDRLLKNSQEHAVMLAVHEQLRAEGIDVSAGLLRRDYSQ